MDPVIFPIVATGIGILAGGAFGLVIRGSRSRRKIETLQSEISGLKTKLANGGDDGGTKQLLKPQRWTGTEIAAVLSAVGSLVGIFWTNYNSARQAKVESTAQELAQLMHKTEQYQAEVVEQFRYEPAAWKKLDLKDVQASKSPTESSLDGWIVSSSCDGLRKAVLKYRGSAPAVLKCNGKSVSIVLDKPTKLMFIPLERPPKP